MEPVSSWTSTPQRTTTCWMAMLPHQVGCFLLPECLLPWPDTFQRGILQVSGVWHFVFSQYCVHVSLHCLDLQLIKQSGALRRCGRLSVDLSVYLNLTSVFVLRLFEISLVVPMFLLKNRFANELIKEKFTVEMTCFYYIQLNICIIKHIALDYFLLQILTPLTTVKFKSNNNPLLSGKAFIRIG